MNSFLTHKEIKEIGFKSVGENVLISRFARFYSPNLITMGNHVRIDDFSILSGNIEIGNNVHIAAYCALYAKERIKLSNYTGLSPRVTIFSGIDDFEGDFLIGPMAPAGTTNLKKGPVNLEAFAQIGASSIIFPDVTINEGSVIGAMSLVKETVESWGIYAGIPLRFIKERKKDLLRYV